MAPTAPVLDDGRAARRQAKGESIRRRLRDIRDAEFEELSDRPRGRDKFAVQRQLQEKIEAGQAQSQAYWTEAMVEAEDRRQQTAQEGAAQAAQVRSESRGLMDRVRGAARQGAETVGAAARKGKEQVDRGGAWSNAGLARGLDRVGDLSNRYGKKAVAAAGVAAAAAAGSVVAAATRQSQPSQPRFQWGRGTGGRSRLGGGGPGQDMVPRRLFVLVGIALHFIAARNAFYAQDSGLRASFLTVYLFLGLLYFLLGAQGNLLNIRRLVGCLALAVLAWFLPIAFVTWLPPESWRNTLLLAMPVWLLWFMFGPDGLKPQDKGGMLVWWLGLGYICFFWLIPGTFNALAPALLALTENIKPAPDQIPDVNDGWQIAKEGFLTGVKKVYEGIRQVTESAYKKFIRETLGDEFFGTVEENSKAPRVGVSLIPLGTDYQVYEPPDRVEAYARLQGYSFVGDILVKSRCWLEPRGTTLPHDPTHVVQGTISPDPPDGVRLVDYDTQDLMCRIPYDSGSPSIKGFLEPGQTLSPTLRFAGTFDFETWGFVAYVFGNKDELRLPETRAKLAKDGYPSRPSPTFTHGPVELGLVSETNIPVLPIGLDLSNPGQGRTQLPVAFGVTIRNRAQYATTGKIVKLTRLEFWLPEPLELGECSDEPALDHEPPARDSDERITFNHYIWEDVRLREYDKALTVRCPLFVDDAAAFLGADNLEIVSFAVKAAYTYELTATVGGFQYRMPKAAEGAP